ncbi:hypothetical protein IIF7_06341 [Zunongwangia atlantica 22II14-10F7]|uniref:Uncharacterized protein n=1 Tax=Zunongwangia atlantica 22II14-10F7 TaxID=1185767 RepID=A0A1Y1T552_9FLAO|nr:hypothetical protein IIF7_06341 [Zunongwangia atlantica 22II14-10F7]
MPQSSSIDHLDFVRVHPDLPYFSFTPVVNEGFKLKPDDKFLKKISSNYLRKTNSRVDSMVIRKL